MHQIFVRMKSYYTSVYMHQIFVRMKSYYTNVYMHQIFVRMKSYYTNVFGMEHESKVPHTLDDFCEENGSFPIRIDSPTTNHTEPIGNTAGGAYWQASRNLLERSKKRSQDTPTPATEELLVGDANPVQLLHPCWRKSGQKKSLLSTWQDADILPGRARMIFPRRNRLLWKSQLSQGW